MFTGSYTSNRSVGVGEMLAMVLTWITCGAGILVWAYLTFAAAIWLAEFVGDRSILPFTLAWVVSVTILAGAGVAWLRDHLRRWP